MKDYKKILEGVANIINTTKKSDIGFVNICTYISENCPELKESEDDRILEIIKHCIESRYLHTSTIKGISQKQCLAWLEKQREHKHKIQPKFKVGDIIRLKGTAATYTIKRVTDTAYYTNGWSCGIERCEEDYELLEQKPAKAPKELLKGEDYGIDGLYHAISILEKTLGEVEGYQSDDGILEHKIAIDTLRALYKQKPNTNEWSKDDEKFFESSLWHIKNSICNGRGIDVQCELTEWFKSLKERVHPKQEWSEKDEQMLTEIVKDLQVYKSREISRDAKDAYQNEIDWLKSIRPQNRWKPSDEQIEILEMVLTNKSMNDNIARILRELREQLKKLKG